MMSRDTLRAFGAALYGPHWQREIARALDVNERSVRRWAAGDFQPPATILPELLDLARARIVELETLIRAQSDARTRS